MVWQFPCENLWEEPFLGITLPCPREKENKKERRRWGRAGLQLESLTWTSHDRSWPGWTSDLNGSLAFRRHRFISGIPGRFLVLPGKPHGYEYTFLVYSRCAANPWASSGGACVWTVYAEVTTGLSAAVQLWQCSTAWDESWELPRLTHLCNFCFSIMSPSSGHWLKKYKEYLIPIIFCAVMETPMWATSLHINSKDLYLPWCRKPYTSKMLRESAQISQFFAVQLKNLLINCKQISLCVPNDQALSESENFYQ